MPVTTTPRQQVYDFVRLRLGDGLVDVELDPEHYDSALDFAIATYRQRGQNSVEEAHAFLELEQDVTEYTLPTETVSVRNVMRRGVGTATAGTSFFDPFQSAYVNTYLINTGRTGGLLTYELFAGYQELSFRMFGGYIVHYYNPVSRKLTIPRKVLTQETVLLHVFMQKPEDMLLVDPYVGPWLKSYSLAQCKIMLGQAREKFATIASPGGSAQLNGAALKAEGQAETEKLIEELKLYVDNSQPLTFIIG